MKKRTYTEGSGNTDFTTLLLRSLTDILKQRQDLLAMNDASNDVLIAHTIKIIEAKINLFEKEVGSYIDCIAGIISL